MVLTRVAVKGADLMVDRLLAAERSIGCQSTRLPGLHRAPRPNSIADPRRMATGRNSLLSLTLRRRCAMPATYNILIMGAAYGSLLASKILFGGHRIHHVCLPAEADLINAEGFRVRLPVRGRKDPVELDSRKLPGKVTAGPATGVNPKDYDLIGLAMQEPQYRSPGVRELLDAVAKSRVPCMSIMNMPPLPYVKRIPGLNYEALKPAYTDPSVWDSFDPATITLNSPDPQAIRPPDEKVNVLMVTLPTNFKVARFDDEKSTAILRNLEKDVEAARFDASEGKIELPVKLKVYDSIFVPLAKWAMLLAGNHRCATKDGQRTDQAGVHSGT